MARRQDLALHSPRANYAIPTPARSRTMAAVKSFGNRTTEEKLAKVLRVSKVAGWRRHYPVLGRPDFAFPKAKLAVFVDGCFWHGCPRCYRAPATNRRFWRAKYEYNVERDRRISRALRKSGWKVQRFWEHELANPGQIATRIRGAARVKR